MQIRAPDAPREARRLRRAPLKGGAPMFADSGPWGGPFGLLGELGPRPPSVAVQTKQLNDQGD
eukprot:3876987-Alexandrium_andersonii.AAC.1